jgi:hypothetical protein
LPQRICHGCRRQVLPARPGRRKRGLARRD